ATILMGAALEGVLLKFFREENAFIEAYSEYSRKNKKIKSIYALTLGEIIQLGSKANLYPLNQNESNIEQLFRLSNDIRSLVHPGRMMSAHITELTDLEYSILKNLYDEVQSHYRQS